MPNGWRPSSILYRYTLSHWGRVTHICFGKLTIIGSDNGLSPHRRKAIISTNAVNWTLKKLQWNCNRNSNIFIEENTFDNVVCKMLSISSQPQCVNEHPYGNSVTRPAFILVVYNTYRYLDIYSKQVYSDPYIRVHTELLGCLISWERLAVHKCSSQLPHHLAFSFRIMEMKFPVTEINMTDALVS